MMPRSDRDPRYRKSPIHRNQRYRDVKRERWVSWVPANSAYVRYTRRPAGTIGWSHVVGLYSYLNTAMSILENRPTAGQPQGLPLQKRRWA